MVVTSAWRCRTSPGRQMNAPDGCSSRTCRALASMPRTSWAMHSDSGQNVWSSRTDAVVGRGGRRRCTASPAFEPVVQHVKRTCSEVSIAGSAITCSTTGRIRLGAPTTSGNPRTPRSSQSWFEQGVARRTRRPASRSRYGAICLRTPRSSWRKLSHPRKSEQIGRAVAVNCWRRAARCRSQQTDLATWIFRWA